MQIRLLHRLGAALLAVTLAACAGDPSTPPSGTDASPGVPNTPSSTGTAGAGNPSAPGAPSTAGDGTSSGTTQPSGPTPGLTLSVHTTLGIPEAASPDDPQHALVVKPQYVVSFDGARKNPRWTSWELTSAWLGSTSRSLAFFADPMLSPSIPQAKQSDYTNSGFSRGHLCPSADRTDSVADNEATFEFTNVVPQTTASNTGPWEDLERQERALATAGHHLFIVAGSRYESDQTIGAGVSVPTSMFKVVVVMDGDAPRPSDVTAATRVIAVDIPNTTTVQGTYTDFLTSFGQLETETGLHFMADVAAGVHDALAAKVDGAAN